MEAVEVVANEEMMSGTIIGDDDDAMMEESVEVDIAGGMDGTQNKFHVDPRDDVDGELPTIFEIAGIDSSNDSLPDHIPQQILDYHGNFLPTLNSGRQGHPPPSPVRQFLQSDRRARIQKANSNSDFEMRQLDAQLALTQQHTHEIMAMRKEQSRLEDQLKKEKQATAIRNEQLQVELRKIEKEVAQIAKAEADLVILANQYQARMQVLTQQQDQMRSNMRNMHKDPLLNQLQATTPVGQATISTMHHSVHKEMVHRVEDTETSSSKEPANNISKKKSPQPTTTSRVTMVACKTKKGRAKKVPVYSKGTKVYYNYTAANIEIPAVIVDVHQCDLLVPYYSIRTEDGREKQTDNAHIRLMNVGM